MTVCYRTLDKVDYGWYLATDSLNYSDEAKVIGFERSKRKLELVFVSNGGLFHSFGDVIGMQVAFIGGSAVPISGLRNLLWFTALR